jgi:hypothetical protein
MIMYLCCVVGGEGRERCKFITTVACVRKAQLLAMISYVDPTYHNATQANSVHLIPIANTVPPTITSIVPSS